MKFIVWDAITGRIIRTGTCADADFKFQVRGENERVKEGEADDEKHAIDPKTEERIILPPKAELEPDYRELRRRAYPPIADQLDALWTGGDATAEMKAKIDSVKAIYPKVVG